MAMAFQVSCSRTLLKQRLCWGPHLQHIHLTHKILLQSPLARTGALPDSIGNLSALQTLMLSNNQFEGTEFCTEHETQPRRTLLRGCLSDHVIDALFVILCLKSSQTDSRRPTYSSLRTQAQCRSRSGTLRPSRSCTCRSTLFQVSWRTLLRRCPSTITL